MINIKFYVWSSRFDSAIVILHTVQQLGQLMMTSLTGNIFPVAGPFWGESAGHRWTPLINGQQRGALFSLICAWTNGWANNRNTGDLRHHRAYYGVTVMKGHETISLRYFHWISISVEISCCFHPLWGIFTSSDKLNPHLDQGMDKYLRPRKYWDVITYPCTHFKRYR